jgi:hypothetical protein
MPTGVNLRLFDGTIPRSNLTGIQALWWDVTEPKDASEPVGKSSLVTTDSDGYINLDLSNVTGLVPGEYGFLMLYKLDVSNHQDSLIFSGKVQTSTITSGIDMYYYDSGWTRPASWLALPTVLSSDEKFVGLHAVYPEGNFVALSATGNYVINWGDGTGDINVNSGVTAEKEILWANAPANSDVGIADAIACTFTDSGDTVGVTAHGRLNNEIVAFSTINSTTGISTYTSYYVVNKTADTFQLATTAGGSAITLTTDGTGYVYTPKYRQVIVTLTPQGGQYLTSLNLHVKHSSQANGGYSSQFLDIVLSGQYLTDLRLSVLTPGASGQLVRFQSLQQFSMLNSNLKQCEYLFYSCTVLKSIPSFVTSSDPASSASVTFTDAGDLVTHVGHGRLNGDIVIFSAINSTTGIATYTRYFIINKTADTYQVSAGYGSTAISLSTNGTGTAVYGTSFSFLFAGCASLLTIPLFNASSVIYFYEMFYSCSSLDSIPRINTSAGLLCHYMFYACSALVTIPLLDMSANVNFNNMFTSCYSLQAVPLLNTAAGTTFSYMFYGCSSLTTIPKIDTSQGTNFNNMFMYDSSFISIPRLNTMNGTLFTNMFNGCGSLITIPLLDTSSGTNLSGMFNSCQALMAVPMLYAAAASNTSSIFSNCSSLSSAALKNTSRSIDYSYEKLSASALNTIYTNLAKIGSGSVTFQVAANTVTKASHELIEGITTSFSSITGTTGISNSSVYYVRNPTTDTFQLSATPTGAIIDLTGSDGTASFQAQTITVTGNYGVSGDTPSIATAKGWTVTG